jgi:hypothetical protein
LKHPGAVHLNTILEKTARRVEIFIRSETSRTARVTGVTSSAGARRAAAEHSSWIERFDHANAPP